jgi:hypothetical protein
MVFSIPSGSEIINRSKETLGRFPLAMVASFVVACISIYLVEMDRSKLEGINLTLAKIALSASLAVFVFTAMRLLAEQLSRKWHAIWMFLGVVGIVAYYLWLPDRSEDFGATMVPFRHFFLSLLSLVGFLWAPFVRKSLDNPDYWEYAKHILFALVMTFLFTIIAILGINGAIFAVEKLFDINIESKRYFEIDIFIIGVFSVGYFLSQISQHPLASRFTTEPPRVERFFTKWLLTSLSGLYFVILYVYTAKVLLTMDWPKGILAWLIVIFSTVAIFTYLFWTHFAKTQDGGWRRWIWLAVLLQTVMLFVAIGIRIMEYSWTESRYMVFVLGVWLAGVSLYFLLFKQAQLKWIFLSLSLLIAITQFGPLSAYSVSRTAQIQRLQENVTKLKSYTVTTKAPLKLRYEISDGIQYLHRRYKGDALFTIFPEKVSAFKRLKAQREKAMKKRKKDVSALPVTDNDKPRHLPEYITSELGFDFINKWEYRRSTNGEKKPIEFRTKGGFPSESKRMLTVKGYDYVAIINQYGYKMVDCNGTLKASKRAFVAPDASFVYTTDFRLEITLGDDTVSFDLAKKVLDLVAKYGERKKNMDKDEMVLQGQRGRTKVKLQLDTLGKGSINKHEIIHFSGTLLLKEAE